MSNKELVTLSELKKKKLTMSHILRRNITTFAKLVQRLYLQEPTYDWLHWNVEI